MGTGAHSNVLRSRVAPDPEILMAVDRDGIVVGLVAHQRLGR